MSIHRRPVHRLKAGLVFFFALVALRTPLKPTVGPSAATQAVSSVPSRSAVGIDCTVGALDADWCTFHALYASSIASVGICVPLRRFSVQRAAPWLLY